MAGFACGTALKGSEFARANYWSIVAYYSVVFATYGLVSLAISLGATEQDTWVMLPQHLGCFMLTLGPILGLWLVARALGMLLRK